MAEILIGEVGGKVGTAVARSLRRHGLSVAVFDCPACVHDDYDYAKRLAAEAVRVEARVLFPIFKAEAIARFRGLFPTDLIIIAGEYQAVHDLDDKIFTSALATELGIPQPRLYASPAAVDAYPCVFKRPAGLGGAGVYFPRTPEALENLCRKAGKKGGLIMEYIDGRDVSVDAIRWGGWFHAEAYEVLVPKVKGTSCVRRTVSAPALVDAAKKILDKMDYNGVCGFDFRAPSGAPLDEAMFLECNPRFSGGVGSHIKAGFDIPWILYQLATGGQPADFNYRVGSLSVDWKELFQSRNRIII